VYQNLASKQSRPSEQVLRGLACKQLEIEREANHYEVGCEVGCEVGGNKA
jgi:hypothetical protein